MPQLQPVASVLARGPVPLSQSAKIVIRLCKLLEPIHATGGTHGALAPENVRFHQVGGDLEVELVHDAAAPPTYAPPERVGGAAETPSADVYGLGVLFFHMISGVPPFEGESPDEILQKHVADAPPGLAHNELQEIPEELEQLVQQMLSKQPAARPSVSTVAATVENLDLDSTVMGVRLSGVKEIAQEIQAEEGAVLETEDPDLPKLDMEMLKNVPVDVESGVRTDPVIADPYADTFIRQRADIIDEGDAEVDGEADTAVSMEQPPASWTEGGTRIIEDADQLASEPPRAKAQRAPRSIALFAVGLAFLAGALLTAALVLWP